MTTDVCLEVYSENVVVPNVEVTLYLASRTVKGRVIDQSEFFGRSAEMLATNGADNSENHHALLTKWKEDYAALKSQQAEDLYLIGEAAAQGNEDKAERLRQKQWAAKFIHLADVEVLESGEVRTVQGPLRVKLENVEAWTLGR